MILCEEIVIDPTRANRYTLVGVTHAVHSFSTPPYPYTHSRIYVFAQLTSCHGPGKVRIEVVEGETDKVEYKTPTWRFPFPNDPLTVYNLSVRLRDVPFREPGLYGVRLWYNNALLAEQSLVAR
jgi:hypothetical protein